MTKKNNSSDKNLLGANKNATVTQIKDNAAQAKDNQSAVQKLFLQYPRLKHLYDKIAHCHEYSKTAADPECLLITGETGVGKSTLRERYAQQYPRYQKQKLVNGLPQTVTIVPVLGSRIPAPAAIKSFVTRLLFDLGDPMAPKGQNISDLTLRLEKTLKDCEVDLIILDEFQHIMDQKNRKLLGNTADWLKNLIDNTGIPIILMGLPNSIDLLEENKQLKRRFIAQECLEPFGWEDSEDRREFRKLLMYLDKSLGLPKLSNLSDEDVALRFFAATGGVIAHVMKIVRRATDLCIARHEESLTLPLLAEVYAENFASVSPNENPFDTALSSLKAPKKASVRFSENSTNNRVKAKVKELRTSDVL